MSIAANLKAQLIQVVPRTLWQYDFVHRWQPPESISAEAFIAEAELFKASLLQAEPLSNQPIERSSFWDSLPDAMVSKAIESRSTPKISKARNTFLEEVSELPELPKSPKSKQSSKKKKKKGFQP